MEGGGCTIDAGRREGGGVREAEAHLATTTVSEGCRSLHSMNAVLLILILLTTSTRAIGGLYGLARPLARPRHHPTDPFSSQRKLLTTHGAKEK